MIPGNNDTAILKRKKETFDFRKESFEIVYHYLIDSVSKEQYTIPEIDEINLAQIHNQYRAKYGIPFVDEIKAIREQYGLSASKMSDVLGLGTNVYRNYELGEIPSPSNGRLIQLIKNPENFKTLIALSKNDLTPSEIEKIHKKIENRLTSCNSLDKLFRLCLQHIKEPDENNGFKSPSLHRIAQMIKFFTAERMPYLSSLNQMMFLSDFIYFSGHGYGISGLSYVTLNQFTVPKNYGSIYDFLAANNFIEKTIVQTKGDEIEQFINRGDDPDLTCFESAEIQLMKNVVHHSGKRSFFKLPGAKHGAEYSYVHAFELNYPH